MIQRKRNGMQIYLVGGDKKLYFIIFSTLRIVGINSKSLRPPPRGLRDHHHNPRTLKEKKKGHVIVSDKSRHSRPAAVKDRKIYLCYIHGSAFGGTRHHPILGQQLLINILVSKSLAFLNLNIKITLKFYGRYLIFF